MMFIRMLCLLFFYVFFFKQKTSYEMRISDWSSDVCSSYLIAEKSVPKMMLFSPPREGGAIAVRSLIPHRVHASIGVLGAVTVATACLIEGSPAAADRKSVV